MRLLLVPLLVGCGSPDAPVAPTVVGIEVKPDEESLVTGPSGAEPIDFEAWATYDDGSEAALEVVEWALSNRSVGTIDEDGVFVASTENGGTTWVTAELGGVRGSATLTVTWKDAVVVGDADPTAFSGPENDGPETWLYPEDGVNLPRNTPSITFMWEDVGATTYRLRFRSDVTDLTVYTAEPSWTASTTEWQTITSTNAGGEVSVQLASAGESGVLVEPARTLAVNRLDATGSILYWSTSVAGFKEIPYGEEANDYLTQEQVGACVGCHVVSSTGLIAFTYDGGNGGLGVKRLDDGSDVIGYGSGYLGNFKAFSPDGQFLVSTYYGELSLFDAESGTLLGAVPTDGGATHPDWSPDGTRIVFTQTDGHSADWYWEGTGRVATVEHLGDGSFGVTTVLYEPPEGQKAYYPAWSPDGEWIAFNVSTGDAYDDPDAEVWVISGEGGDPIRLDRFNQTENLYNSWPRWGPLPDDDVLWLAVASRRAYGDQVEGTPQIWVGAFDPARAAQGKDPSWPAFWLPGQDVAQGNHIPVWVE